MPSGRSSDPPSIAGTTSPDVKVLAAVASFLLLVVIAVVLAVVLVVTLSFEANAVERRARYSSAIDAAALHAKGMANNERGFLINGDEDFITQLEGRAELVRAAFAAAAEAADDGHRATVAEAGEGFERWLATLEEEVAVYQAGDEEAAIEMSLGPTRAQRWAYEGWLADAKSLGVEGFQNATESVAGASTLSLFVLVGYLVLAVAVAVAVAVWLLRSVLRPAYALADADKGSTPA